MKKIHKLFLALAGSAMILTSCDDWTEVELKNPEELVKPDRTEEYYQRLREYKERKDHSVAFGWFGNWTGTGSSLENSLRGLPDSVDFVSIWGNFNNLSDDQKADLKYVQEVKGTKALICFLVLDIGDQITPPQPEGKTWQEWRHEFWGWGEDTESRIAAAEKYANALCDTIDKYGYDGFDLDAEPGFSHPFHTDYELWRTEGVIDKFIETMSKRIGPKSGTGRMFVIDGEPDAVDPKYGEYFDYFIVQAYGSSSFSSLDSRYRTQLNHFKEVLTPEQIANKLIVCENFENWAATGGVSFSLPDGSYTTSLLGFAKWNPTYEGQTLRKGGVGSYHMEYEYKVSDKPTNYPWLREAIRIMNPVIK